MKNFKNLPILGFALIAVACGQPGAGDNKSSNSSAANTAAETIDGNWNSPCTYIGSQNYYKTVMSFSTASGRVTTSYPAYSDPSCSSYKGNASSNTSASFSLGGALSNSNGSIGGNLLTMSGAYGSTTQYSYSLSSGRLVLLQISISQYGALATGTAVTYSR